MASETLFASGNTGSTNMTISSSYPITNAYDGSSDTSNYARYSLTASTTGYVYLTYDTSSIPSNAIIESVTANARLRISSTSRVTSRSCQLYSGTTAKGTSVSFSSTSSGGEVVSPTAGTWTRSDLNDLRMRIEGTASSSSQSKYIYIYGTDITVTYTLPGGIFIKSNGTWVQYSKVYKKINGSWVEQDSSNWSTVLPTTDNYKLIQV